MPTDPARRLVPSPALGDFDQVKAILDADPMRISEDCPDASRPLTAAADFGRIEIVRLLLVRGGLASVDTQNRQLIDTSKPAIN